MTTSTSRRALITSAATVAAAIPLAALPMMPAPAAATVSAADPIYAALDHYRDALRTFETLLDRKADFEEAYFAARDKFADASPFDAAEMETGEAEIEAAWQLVSTEPTSLRGIAALLAFLRTEADRGSSRFCDEDHFAALNASIEATVCQLAGLPEPPLPKRIAPAEAA